MLFVDNYYTSRNMKCAVTMIEKKVILALIFYRSDNIISPSIQEEPEELPKLQHVQRKRPNGMDQENCGKTNEGN